MAKQTFVYIAIYCLYHRRVLLLASDVELNPGPTQETELILKAIETANEKKSSEISELGNDKTSLKSDLSCVQSDIRTIKTKVKKFDEQHSVLENELKSIKSKVDGIERTATEVERDIGELAINDEVKGNCIENMLSQMNMIDRELRKSNLHIFGVPDMKDETPNQTRQLVANLPVSTNDGDMEDETHIQTNPTFSHLPDNATSEETIGQGYNFDNSILFAKRIGKFSGNDRPRMIR